MDIDNIKNKVRPYFYIYEGYLYMFICNLFLRKYLEINNLKNVAASLSEIFFGISFKLVGNTNLLK